VNKLTIFSDCISSFFSPVPTDEPQTPIFTKYSSSSSIPNAMEKQRNLYISDRLINYTFKNAVLTECKDGKISFDYTDNFGQECCILSKDEKTLNEWLGNKKEVDIWEIEDRRSGKSIITYKLQRAKEWGYDHFSSDQALFEAITKESGRIWKLEDIENKEILYMIARWDSWSGKFSFEDRNLEDLSYMADLEDLSRIKTPSIGHSEPVTFKKGFKAAVWTTFILYVGYKYRGSYLNALSKSMMTALTVHSIGAKGFGSSASSTIAIGYHLFSEAFAQNILPPNITGSSPFNINVNVGDQITIGVASFFSDPNGFALGFSGANLPPFLNYNPVPFQSNAILPTGDGKGGAAIVGNNLHVFGGTSSPYQIFGLHGVNPPQILGSFSAANNYFGGAVDGDYTYLPAGPNGLQIVNSKNPNALNLVATVPATTSVENVIIVKGVAWYSDGSSLKSANVTNPSNPLPLGSFMEMQPIKGISVGNNNLIYVVSTVGGGLRIISISNPSNPVSLGFNFLAGFPSGLSCIINQINDVCYVPQGSTVGSYIMSAPTPTQTALIYAPGNGNYNSNVRNGLLFVTDNNLRTITAFNPNNNANPFYSSFNLTQVPYHVLSVNNLLYVTTSNGTMIFAVNQDTVSGIPTAADQGIHTFTLTASDFNGGNVPLQFNVQVLNPIPPNSQAGLIGGIIAGVLVVLVGGVLVVVGRVVYKKRKKVLEDVELSPKVVKKFFKNSFGNNQYFELDWNVDEMTSCYDETGLIPDNDGKISSGKCGTTSVCWTIKKEERYVVMKVVDKEDKFDKSEKEAKLQTAAAGPGIWPLINYTMDKVNKRFVLLLEVAGLRDISFVNQRIKDTKKSQEEREIYTTCLGKSFLEGIVTLNKKGMVHFDIKPKNVFVGKNGECGIGDFGCAFKPETLEEKNRFKKEGKAPNEWRDRDCRSPENVENDKFASVTMEDPWGAGLVLLELLSGIESKEIVNYEKGYLIKKNNNKDLTFSDHIKERFDTIPGLKNPEEGSIWHVAKMLLQIDPKERWTAAEALESKCFKDLDKNLDASAKKKMFNDLVPEAKFNTFLPPVTNFTPNPNNTVPSNPNETIYSETTTNNNSKDEIPYVEIIYTN
jgi:serine/threonine protein kinase